MNGTVAQLVRASDSFKGLLKRVLLIIAGSGVQVPPVPPSTNNIKRVYHNENQSIKPGEYVP